MQFLSFFLSQTGNIWRYTKIKPSTQNTRVVHRIRSIRYVGKNTKKRIFLFICADTINGGIYKFLHAVEQSGVFFVFKLIFFFHTSRIVSLATSLVSLFVFSSLNIKVVRSHRAAESVMDSASARYRRPLSASFVLVNPRVYSLDTLHRPVVTGHIRLVFWLDRSHCRSLTIGLYSRHFFWLSIHLRWPPTVCDQLVRLG